MSKGGKTEGFAGPPAWVWRSRPAIGVGPWQVLMFMWSYVSFDEISDLDSPPSKPVYPSRDELADQIGCNPDNITTHWRTLKRLGLISKVGTRGAGIVAWRLEWRPDVADRPVENHDPRKTTTRGKPLVTPVENHESDPRKTTTPPVENHWSDPRKTTDGTHHEHHQLTHQPTHQAEQAARDADRTNRHLVIQANQKIVERVSRRLTREYIRAIQAIGDGHWDRELQRDQWRTELEARIEDENLGPDEVVKILLAWEAQVEELGGIRHAKVRMGKGGVMPARAGIWFDTWAKWRMAILGIEAPEDAPVRRSGGFSPALSTAEAHHQRAVEAGEARRAAAPKRDPDEVAREAARYAAIFEGAEDMLL